MPKTLLVPCETVTTCIGDNFYTAITGSRTGVNESIFVGGSIRQPTLSQTTYTNVAVVSKYDIEFKQLSYMMTYSEVTQAANLVNALALSPDDSKLAVVITNHAVGDYALDDGTRVYLMVVNSVDGSEFSAPIYID